MFPRADQRRPQLGECPERLANRGRLVPELRFGGARGFAIRSADDSVVGLHHRVGDERLLLDGADRENREAAVVRELAEPVGEVALPLPAQPRDPMRRECRRRGLREPRVPTRSVRKYTLRRRPEASGAHEAVEGGPGHAGDLGDGGLGDAELEEAPDFVLLAVEP